jgi:Flp pilus assembly protein TadD, contains TPR repeats
MKLLLFLSSFLYFAFAYNPYRDYVLCRYLQESMPQEAINFCLRALQRAPTPTLYVDTIRLLAVRKRFQEALFYAEKFKREYPQDKEPYLVLHSIYALKGDRQKALEALEEGYRANPNSKDIMIFLTDEYIRRNRLQDAKGVLERLADLAVDNPLPYYMLARIYLTEGKKEKAIEYLNKSLQIKKTFEAGFTTLGSIYEGEKEFSKAESLYLGVLKEEPTNRTALERLANLYTITGRFQDAKDVYKKLIDYYPERGYKLRYIYLLIRTSDFGEAEELARELYSQEPDNLDVAFAYGVSLEANKKIDQALKVYEKLLEQNPNNTKVMERLAVAYMDQKDYKRAEGLVKRALELEPNNPDLNLLMANLLSAQEKNAEALPFVDKAIQLNPRDYRGYFLKAIILDKLGRIIDAERNLREAIRLNPEDPELFNHLGYSLLLWYEDARLSEAEELILKALSKDPENPAYVDSYAWVLYYKRQYQRAYELLLKALEKEKEDPVIWEHIGDVLMKLNKKDQALDAYRKSWQLLEEGKRGEPGQKERLKKKLKD